jgi:hypothetical protein
MNLFIPLMFNSFSQDYFHCLFNFSYIILQLSSDKTYSLNALNSFM